MYSNLRNLMSDHHLTTVVSDERSQRAELGHMCFNRVPVFIKKCGRSFEGHVIAYSREHSGDLPKGMTMYKSTLQLAMAENPLGIFTSKSNFMMRDQNMRYYIFREKSQVAKMCETYFSKLSDENVSPVLDVFIFSLDDVSMYGKMREWKMLVILWRDAHPLWSHSYVNSVTDLAAVGCFQILDRDVNYDCTGCGILENTFESFQQCIRAENALSKAMRTFLFFILSWYRSLIDDCDIYHLLGDDSMFLTIRSKINFALPLENALRYLMFTGDHCSVDALSKMYESQLEQGLFEFIMKFVTTLLEIRSTVIEFAGKPEKHKDSWASFKCPCSPESQIHPFFHLPLSYSASKYEFSDAFVICRNCFKPLKIDSCEKKPFYALFCVMSDGENLKRIPLNSYMDLKDDYGWCYVPHSFLRLDPQNYSCLWHRLGMPEDHFGFYFRSDNGDQPYVSYCNRHVSRYNPINPDDLGLCPHRGWLLCKQIQLEAETLSGMSRKILASGEGCFDELLHANTIPKEEMCEFGRKLFEIAKILREKDPIDWLDLTDTLNITRRDVLKLFDFMSNGELQDYRYVFERNNLSGIEFVKKILNFEMDVPASIIHCLIFLHVRSKGYYRTVEDAYRLSSTLVWNRFSLVSDNVAMAVVTLGKSFDFRANFELIWSVRPNVRKFYMVCNHNCHYYGICLILSDDKSSIQPHLYETMGLDYCESNRNLVYNTLQTQLRLHYPHCSWLQPIVVEGLSQTNNNCGFCQCIFIIREMDPAIAARIPLKRLRTEPTCVDRLRIGLGIYMAALMKSLITL